MIKLLAISGSLRCASINTALLGAISEAVIPYDVQVILYRGLGDLPFFNPDIEDREPSSVLEFRSALSASDGIIISSPEYAHGITGVLKNALDWVVGSGEFVGKPVAILNAAPRSSYAFKALNEVLHTIDAKIIAGASVEIPVLGRHLDSREMLEDLEISSLIGQVISVMVQEVNDIH